MAFKLYSDSFSDIPRLVCDVCSEVIVDVWSDKATGSPSHDGQTTDVTIHHAACPASGAVTILLIDFMRLFAVQARIGDLGSNGQIDTAHVQYRTGRGFEAP